MVLDYKDNQIHVFSQDNWRLKEHKNRMNDSGQAAERCLQKAGTVWQDEEWVARGEQEFL